MRIAVIGLGFMGATHIAALRGIAGADLSAVVSSDPRKLAGDLSGIQGNLGPASGQMDFGTAARYSTIQECLRDPNVDAVDICVPTDLHEEIAVAALRAAKHVLVEKPMALDEASADRMIAEAERAGRTLMCAQVLRFMPDYRTAAEQTPALGKVQSAMFRRKCGAPSWNQWLGHADRSGGGAFDLLIHDVDYSVKLFGRPESITATGFTSAAHGIDWIVAEFRYAHTGPVVIEGGWYAPSSYPFSMEFTIMGEAGTLDYSSAGRPLASLTHEGGSQPLEVSGADGFTAELAYFIDCAANGLPPNLCPVADSALSVRLMREMLAARERRSH